MIALFRFGYGTELTDEQIDALNAVLSKRIELSDELSESGLKKPVSWQQYTADLEVVYQIAPDARVEVLKVNHTNIFHRFARIVEKMEGVYRDFNRDHMFNGRVNVHVPGLGLLAINEVTWRENCCTEALQEMLDDGWRIIACCPQPDQRRPDYILGRTRPRSTTNDEKPY